MYNTLLYMKAQNNTPPPPPLILLMEGWKSLQFEVCKHPAPQDWNFSDIEDLESLDLRSVEHPLHTGVWRLTAASPKDNI